MVLFIASDTKGKSPERRASMFQDKLAEFHDYVYEALSFLVAYRPANCTDGEVFDCAASEFAQAFRQAYEDVLAERGFVVA